MNREQMRAWLALEGFDTITLYGNNSVISVSDGKFDWLRLRVSNTDRWERQVHDVAPDERPADMDLISDSVLRDLVRIIESRKEST